MLVSQRLVGVADGATPLAEGWPDPGAFSGDVLSAARDAADPTSDTRDVWLSAIRCATTSRGRWKYRLTASAAWLRRRAGGVIEVSSLGDCRVVLWLCDGRTIMLHDDRVPELDALVDAAPEYARNRLRRAHREAANTPRGYWVVGDDESAADNSLNLRLAEEEVLAVLLATDGLSRWAGTEDAEALRALVAGSRKGPAMPEVPPDDVAAVLTQRAAA